MSKVTKARFPHSFGVFSPTGYVLMAFADDDSAEKACEALIRGGFREDDVIHYGKQEVLAELEKDEEHSEDPLQIGQEMDKVNRYIELAKQGAGFLALHAPEEELSRRAINIVRPFRLKFAEKYNRLTMEELA
jgi:hypothetical protein